MNSSNKRIYLLFFSLLNISLDLLFCKPIEYKLKSFGDDDEITTITKDSELELIEAINILNEKGGTIYIDTPVINMVEEHSLLFAGNLPGGIIGIRQDNGEYPRINFIHPDNKDSFIFSGIHIAGSNQFIEYLIIENSLDDGIVVYGHNNIFDRVITGYNYGSGFSIYGDFNNFNYCYSYKIVVQMKYWLIVMDLRFSENQTMFSIIVLPGIMLIQDLIITDFIILQMSVIYIQLVGIMGM